MAISLADLPPAMRDQAVRKWQAQRKPEAVASNPPKYHNVPTVAGGIKHASKREAARYMELLTMYRAGMIQDLRLQADFTLQEAYTTPEGERVRAIRYRADFVYWQDGVRVVEDSKGMRTKEYAIKRKMMQERLGIRVVEA